MGEVTSLVRDDGLRLFSLTNTSTNGGKEYATQYQTYAVVFVYGYWFTYNL
ncbi:hypothetical protein TanjilG_29359 [Lupinus angustifolius]|uniref:Uncharacterized protein n=1 Tax=Lupinus angustifolius TaxID=3871 RepID=A0A394DM43_LUPAN|nr:hypothetical protein TanjilG_29359 [Lupinus angustifolius]